MEMSRTQILNLIDKKCLSIDNDQILNKPSGQNQITLQLCKRTSTIF